MKLSYQRALWAAYTVLERLFNDEDPYKLGELLSEMNPFLFTPRVCADPYLWSVWTDRCKSVDSSGFLTFEQVMPVLVEFLKFNEKEYSCFKDIAGDYSADAVVSALSVFVDNGNWEDILNRVYNFVDEENP